MPEIESNPDDVRARLWHSLLKPSRGQMVVAVILAVLAFAAVTQVRVSGRDDNYAGLRQADLIQTLNGLQAASRRAESDIAALEQTRDALRSTGQRRSAALAQARKQSESMGILAGTLPATGPGIMVSVTDPQGQLSTTHLLDAIEELRDSGAEAMQINDRVRVVASTSFEQGSGGILVDGVQLRQPYILTVIGDPGTLSSGLNFQGGFTDDVHADGGEVTIKESGRVTVDVVRRDPQPKFAQPAG